MDTKNQYEEEQTGTEDAKNEGSPADRIKESGMVVTDNGGHRIQCLTIIGQIEGHYILPSQNKTTKYEHVIPQLVAIEEDPETEGLLMILNTVGGDVEAGLALAELISGMRKPDGVACSGRRTLDRRAACRCGKTFVYCAFCDDDHSSGSDEWNDDRRAADVRIFSADAGSNYTVCDAEFPNFPQTVL